MVVGPHKEQHLHPVAVITGDFRDLHLVQGYRDGSHGILGQHQLKQPGKLLGIQRHISQDLRELIHYTAQQFPQLAVLRRQLQLSPLLQKAGARLHLARQIQYVQEPPQGP